MPASSNANRQRNEKRGHTAETAALVLLRLKGYRLLARRFKSHHGEIDLIKDLTFKTQFNTDFNNQNARNSDLQLAG